MKKLQMKKMLIARMRRHKNLAIILGVTVAAIGLMFFTQLGTQDGAALRSYVGGFPVNPLDSQNTDWFSYELQPGATYKDTLGVRNWSDKSWVVDVYAADQIPSNDGGFALKQKSEKMVNVGNWIKLSQTRFTVAPREVLQVPFEITVPKNISIGTKIAGGIMFEERDLALVQAEKDKQDKKDKRDKKDDDAILDLSGVKISLRSGTRVYVDVLSPDAVNAPIARVTALRVKETGPFSNTIQIGDRHPDVIRLKKSLSVLGYYVAVEYSDLFTPELQTALIEYQKINNINGRRDIGILSNSTKQKLNAWLRTYQPVAAAH